MDKYLRKISGLVATLNKIERELVKSNESYNDFTQFGFEWHNVGITNHEIGTHAAHFYSDLQHFPYSPMGERQFRYTTPAWGGLKPTHVYLFDRYFRDKQSLEPIVTFLRKAINNGGLDGMKFGTIEVVSKMADYLNVIEE